MDDLIGQVFGQLTVIGSVRMKGRPYWVCECTCGNKVESVRAALTSGKTTSCKVCSRKRMSEATTVSMAGQTFGKLTVTGFAYSKKHNGGRSSRAYWNCVCSCGKEVNGVEGKKLRNGHTQSCGCKMSDSLAEKYSSETGKVYGKLTVVEVLPCHNKTLRKARVRCECGKEIIRNLSIVTNGSLKSCGCAKAEAAKERRKYHVGQTYGDVTILEEIDKNARGQRRFKIGYRDRVFIAATNDISAFSNPINYLIRKIRQRYRKAVVAGGFTKSRSVIAGLGCSYDELYVWLMAPFKGEPVDLAKYDVEHIAPLAWAKSEEEVVLLNHYTNLRMLPSAENQSKGAAYTPEGAELFRKLVGRDPL